MSKKRVEVKKRYFVEVDLIHEIPHGDPKEEEAFCKKMGWEWGKGDKYVYASNEEGTKIGRGYTDLVRIGAMFVLLHKDTLLVQEITEEK